MLNSINIDLASQYEMIFDEKENYLKIRLDNGQDLKISVFILYYSLIGVTIIAFALIIALVIIICKSR